MPPQSKKNLTLDQLFRAIELEKLKSMDESRTPIERTQSMRVHFRLPLVAVLLLFAILICPTKWRL